MMTEMFDDQYSKWTLIIFDKDMNLEWAIQVIKDKKRMIMVGAFV